MFTVNWVQDVLVDENPRTWETQNFSKTFKSRGVADAHFRSLTVKAFDAAQGYPRSIFETDETGTILQKYRGTAN